MLISNLRWYKIASHFRKAVSLNAHHIFLYCEIKCYKLGENSPLILKLNNTNIIINLVSHAVSLSTTGLESYILCRLCDQIKVHSRRSC